MFSLLQTFGMVKVISDVVLDDLKNDNDGGETRGASVHHREGWTTESLLSSRIARYGLLGTGLYSVYKISTILSRNHQYKSGSLFFGTSRASRKDRWQREENKLYGDYFLNSDGVLLHVSQWPVNEPRAVVLIVHGLGEHAQLYNQVALQLNNYGYTVLGLDLQGHGRSEGDRMFVKRFQDHVEDIMYFIRIAREKFPEKKINLLAHSMGALAAIYACESVVGKEVDGLILSSPLFAGSKSGAVSSFLFRRLGDFFPKFATLTSVASVGNLVKSPIQQDILRNDPLCGWYDSNIPARTGAEIQLAQEDIMRAAANLKNRLLILASEQDSIIGPKEVQDFFDVCEGCDSKRIKIVQDYYHDFWFDENMLGVFPVLQEWLDETADSPGSKLLPTSKGWTKEVLSSFF